MQKKIVSFFFLILFTSFVSAPTIISMVKKSFDSSVFYNINEEENTANETVKIFEVKLLESEHFKLSSIELKKEKSYSYHLINYIPFTSECISPPPEYI